MGEPEEPGQSVRPRRKDAARNREALIAAGRELFDAGGLSPTLDNVALRAGVGVGTAYRHFANKYELADAVLAESFDAMLAEAERAAAHGDGLAGLAAFFEAVLRPQAAKRALLDFLRSAPEGPLLPDVRTRVEACIEQLLERGQAQGTIRAEITSTDVGVLMSLLTTLIDTYGRASPDLWRRFVPLLLDGLRSDAPTPLPVPPLGRGEFLALVKGEGD
ncbi:TetR/AcrR family transcriptional regulator [Actinacidiphila glaucinigra]|uniref:TetR/AcrR family transcriptional regulator n=1 Tax=Actinacidiphila glaucinigra TaxID=235986 RepID=UPI003D8FA8BA